MEAHRSRPPAGGQQSTWIAFAGVLMIILGFFDVLWGIAAIANNEIVVVGGHGVMILNITAWGWIQLILGALVGITGLGLLTGNTAARWAGVALVGINAIVQIVWFSAAPLWALMIIAIDVVIIYQLCVNWERDGSGA
ncbi:MAG: hypothetical protein JST59_26255 [Actinobacteria bacterium]|nr:hypothetical protein [Actinomycetota bacterium]